MTRYAVAILTADVGGAGTDADISIDLSGNQGSTTQYKLDNSEDNFERNKWDYFEFEANDVGDIREFWLYSDNSGSRPDWCVAFVQIWKDSARWGYVDYEERWVAPEYPYSLRLRGVPVRFWGGERAMTPWG